MSKIIALDLDDCLNVLRYPMMQAFNQATGKSYHWSDWTSYGIESIYDIPEEQVMQILWDSNIYKTCLPELGARTFLCLCRHLGYQVVIVSARGWHPESLEVTWDWFERHELPVCDIQLTGLKQTKKDVLQELAKKGELVLYMDDHAGHIKDVETAGIAKHLVLRDMPWNRHHSSKACHRISNLDQVKNLI